MIPTQFDAILPIVTASVSKAISERLDIDELEAFSLLTKSRLYSLIENEETGLWHLSPLTLAMMFEDEQRGEIVFPNVI